jgi:hypothetical protein
LCEPGEPGADCKTTSFNGELSRELSEMEKIPLFLAISWKSHYFWQFLGNPIIFDNSLEIPLFLAIPWKSHYF